MFVGFIIIFTCFPTLQNLINNRKHPMVKTVLFSKMSCAVVNATRPTLLASRFIIGHITPEAQEGGPIALLKDGDAVIIDAENRTINTLVTRVCVMCMMCMICVVCCGSNDVYDLHDLYDLYALYDTCDLCYCMVFMAFIREGS